MLDDDIPSLYGIFPEYSAYHYLSLSIQLAVKDESKSLVNIGYTDLPLGKLFPHEDSITISDKKIPQEVAKIRNNMIVRKLKVSIEKGDSGTIDLEGEIFFFSVKIGTIKLGVQKTKLKLSTIKETLLKHKI